jgi:hypothetical protein
MRILIVLLLASLFLSAGRAAEKLPLKVLYVGRETSERAEQFKTFLSAKVAQVGVANRFRFDPAQAKDYDVVLFEWPQSDRGSVFPPTNSPLGKLKDWVKPTIFLGSAGLQMAVVWDVKGGFG